jgi:ATP/maltotriose-dependent transcriptional regulator MalT
VPTRGSINPELSTIWPSNRGRTKGSSAREIEAPLIAQGKSNQEIAEELFLALNTVKRHSHNIYAKLDVKKRTQAVSKARQLGIIP